MASSIEILGYPLEDTDYNAQDARIYHAPRVTGVYADDDTLLVTAENGDMSVNVTPGVAWIAWDNMNGAAFAVKTSQSLTLDPADDSRPRIDRVVIRVQLGVTEKAYIEIKTGTPASSPEPPELERDTTTGWEICIAEVYVEPGSFGITAANITDKRLDESVCGIAADGVTRIPTQQLHDQFFTWFDELRVGLEDDQFAYLLNKVEAQEVIAGNLQRGDKRYITITESGEFVPADYGLDGWTVDVFISGAGGGGGSGGVGGYYTAISASTGATIISTNRGTGGGGGGGGDMRYISNIKLTEASYPILIGAGGVGGESFSGSGRVRTGTSGNDGTDGGSTSAFGFTLSGGGGGGGPVRGTTYYTLSVGAAGSGITPGGAGNGATYANSSGSGIYDLAEDLIAVDGALLTLSGGGGGGGGTASTQGDTTTVATATDGGYAGRNSGGGGGGGVCAIFASNNATTATRYSEGLGGAGGGNGEDGGAGYMDGVNRYSGNGGNGGPGGGGGGGGGASAGYISAGEFTVGAGGNGGDGFVTIIANKEALA